MWDVSDEVFLFHPWLLATCKLQWEKDCNTSSNLKGQSNLMFVDYIANPFSNACAPHIMF